MKIKFLSFILFLIVSNFGLAQAKKGNGIIDGTVLDSLSKAPIEYAMVRIFSEKDSSLISGIYTDDKGFFVLEEVPIGSFYMKISLFSYRDKTISGIQLSAQKNIRKLGNIALVVDGQVIEPVVVQQDKSALLIGLDKKVYNVGNDISVVGGSATDVLNNVPSIEVDQEGSISLRGDGNVLVLIDGKPSSLVGASGKSILDGIPSSSIERIEIVTNPSAKYDAAGTSGIINIVLKKNIKRGINGVITSSVGTGDLYTTSSAMNYRNSKVNIYGNYGFDHREGYRNNFSDLEQYFTDSISYLDQTRFGKDYNETNNGKIGMDWYIKDRNTLSISASGNLNDRRRSGDQNSYRYSSLGDTTFSQFRDSYEPTYAKNLDLNATYSWDFDKDKGSLSAGLYQSFAKNTNGGYYDQFQTGISDFNQILRNSDIASSSVAQLDLVRIFKEKIRIETGAKAIIRRTDLETNSMSRFGSNSFESDSLANFSYIYDERVISSYFSTSTQVKKFKYQAGVRAEYTYQAPNLVSTNQKFTKEYFNLFPSAVVKYTQSKSLEFSLGYSRRINRPSSDNLNPFTSFADPYNLRYGNPDLSPEFIHSLDLGIDYTKGKFGLNASIYQRYTTDVIQRVKLYFDNGTSAGTFANIDNSWNTGLELIFQYRPLPIWRNTLSINTNYIQFIDETPSVNWSREGFVLGGKYSSTVELMKRTLVIQLNGRFNAPSITAQGRSQPRGSVELSIDKTIKEGKWGFNLRVTDIFDTQGFNFEIDQPVNYQKVTFKWETRRLIASVRYKFGKTELTQDKKGGESQGGGGFDF
ncbi:MAG: TonB-dependent receptor domain-containing protein [Fluviicola sp.]